MTNPEVNLYAATRGASELYNNSANQPSGLVSNNRGDLAVAQALPPYAELVRMGRVWSMRTATASAFNAVAALPTTLAAAILFNNEAAGGKSYVILSMFCTTIVSSAAASQYALLAQALPSPLGVATAPTHSATTTLLTSRSGLATYSGNAKRAINVTTFFTDGWEVVGATGGLAAANIGGGVFADVKGGIIIPPQGALGLNVIAGTVNTAGMIVGCTWAEVQLSLGS
jgi:hypothetical protein